jgi:hypothetical protein
MHTLETHPSFDSRDTTEADLKQRREIGAGGTIRHVNQAVVNAAIHGRVLVLEGLEKVERNVGAARVGVMGRRGIRVDS